MTIPAVRQALRELLDALNEMGAGDGPDAGFARHAAYNVHASIGELDHLENTEAVDDLLRGIMTDMGERGIFEFEWSADAERRLYALAARVQAALMHTPKQRG